MKRALATIIALAVPVLAAAAVGWPGLDAWYVADDFMHIPYIQFNENPWNFFVNPLCASAIFRPLGWTITWYEAHAFGLEPFTLHLTDLVHEGLNVALVFALAAALFTPLPSADPKNGPADKQPSALAPALAAAIVFAVHPVAALTTAWFACRSDLIATHFSLLTLIIIARRPRPKPGLMLLSGLTAFLAVAGKDTHLPLFIAVFALALVRGPETNIRSRIRGSLAATLPALNATLAIICLRLLFLQQSWGYGRTAPSLPGFIAQLEYHLPAVARAAVRDLLIHHVPRGDALVTALAVFGAALLILGGPAAIVRQRAAMAFALALIAVFLIPVWNLSHMLTLREERLMYFPLAGYALAAAALVAAPRRWWLTGACLAAVVFAAAPYGLIARQAVGDWNSGARHNHKLIRAAAALVESFGPRSQVKRIYLLGLGPGHYNLDAMVRFELEKKYWDRVIVPGDQDSFIMTGKELRARHEVPKGVAPSAVPARQIHATNPFMAFETITPPDLLEAAALDEGARVAEWKTNRFEDVTDELKERYILRLTAQTQARENRSFLPSFSLLKSPLPFLWTPGPGIQVEIPRFYGHPYVFTASTNDPYILSPPLLLPALWVTHLEIEMQLPARAYLPPDQDRACVAWETKSRPAFPAEQSVCFPITGDGQVNTYRVPLAANAAWSRSAVVTRLRLDPMTFPGVFRVHRLEFISE